jgi:hypothetical protein
MPSRNRRHVRRPMIRTLLERSPWSLSLKCRSQKWVSHRASGDAHPTMNSTALSTPADGEAIPNRPAGALSEVISPAISFGATTTPSTLKAIDAPASVMYSSVCASFRPPPSTDARPVRRSRRGTARAPTSPVAKQRLRTRTHRPTMPAAPNAAPHRPSQHRGEQLMGDAIAMPDHERRRRPAVPARRGPIPGDRAARGSLESSRGCARDASTTSGQAGPIKLQL